MEGHPTCGGFRLEAVAAGHLAGGTVAVGRGGEDLP